MKVKKQIEEITTYPGTIERDIEETLHNFIKSKFTNNQILKIIKKFAMDEFFLDIRDIDNSALLEYWRDAGLGYDIVIEDPKFNVMEKKFFWTALMYTIIKKNYKLKKYDDLEFLKFNNDYYFFDYELKDYVGYISCFKLKDIISSRSPTPIKKSALCVSFSAVDTQLKGRGYGKKMYLAIIDDAGCLVSDTGLYDESLNIWVNVLPKLVKYVGYIDESYNLKKIRRGDIPKLDKVQRFFATNDPSFLKEPLK
jgi:hypothetical protein